MMMDRRIHYGGRGSIIAGFIVNDQVSRPLLLLHPQRVIVSGKRGLLEETKFRETTTGLTEPP